MLIIFFQNIISTQIHMALIHNQCCKQKTHTHTQVNDKQNSFGLQNIESIDGEKKNAMKNKQKRFQAANNEFHF